VIFLSLILGIKKTRIFEELCPFNLKVVFLGKGRCSHFIFSSITEFADIGGTIVIVICVML
jgi:hypothetical protein